MYSKWIVFAIIITLFIQSIKNKPYRSGATFEIQCHPELEQKQISRARTYALILNNAQKSMEIFIYDKKVSQKYQEGQPSQTGSSSQLKKKHSELIQADNKQQKHETPTCVLSKDNKICVFDGFINSLFFKCNNLGTVTLFLVQPEIIGEIGEDQPLRQQYLAPDLLDQERGVITFKPDNNIDYYQIHNGEIFISNCIQDIQFFNQEILLGVKGGNFIQIVMVNEGITGEWIFTKTKNFYTNNIHAVEAYNIANKFSKFQIIQQCPLVKQDERQMKKNYHGIKMLIRCENRTKISLINITVSVQLYVNDPFASSKVTEYKIEVKKGELQGKIPIQLFFYFAEHPFKTITITTSLSLHFIIQPAEPKFKYHSTLGQIQKYPIVIQEDETLFYCMENFNQSIVKIQTHLLKSYRTKKTSTLRIISWGIQNITGTIKESNENITLVNDEVKKSDVLIQNRKILPLFINDSRPYAALDLYLKLYESASSKQVEKQQVNGSKMIQKYQNMKLFKLLLQTSYIPISIDIGSEVNQFLFENEIKRFLVPKQKMEQLTVKKLKIICYQCHAFMTYHFDCTQIGCCEYSHTQKIEVKQQSLMIIVKAATHLTQTALIKLLLLEDQKAFALEQGQIVQDSLMDSQTYIFETEGKQDMQIIVNSQIQSILLLASLSQFPEKTSFDFQSNEGYIRIPATKVKKTVYIKLIKMLTLSYININEMGANLKIPYTIVIVSESKSFKLIQGKLFNHMLSKNKSRKYQLMHPCTIDENIYLRISSKSYSGNSANKLRNSSNMLLSIGSQKSKIIRQQGTVEVTKYFKKVQNKIRTNSEINITGESNQKEEGESLCEIVANIQNVGHQSMQMSIMYFKEKQMYQIYPGQFIKDHILANKRLIVYSIIDPSKITNAYAYSLNQQITTKVMMISVKEVKQIGEYYEQSIKIQSEKKNKNQRSNANLERIKKFTLLQQYSSKKSSHSQHTYFQSPYQLYGSTMDTGGNLTAIVIQVYRNESNKGFQSSDLVVICTQNQSQLHPGSRLHYQIPSNSSHKFYYKLEKQFILGSSSAQFDLKKTKLLIDRQIILQTTKMVGQYEIQVSLNLNNRVISKIALYKSEIKREKDKNNKKIEVSQSQPIIIIKVSQIQNKINQFIFKQPSDQNNQKIKNNQFSQSAYNNLFLQFTIKCLTQNQQLCLFLTSLQTSQSDIRELTPGIPQPFHMDKHSSLIFIYGNNLHDRQFKFKVNRKRGLPNYKLCSYRPFLSDTSINTQSFDKCLSELQNKEDDLNLRIQEDAFNFDTNFLTGRTHQLIINQFNQQYCTNCTYYLALYSDYDIVQGSIFVMSSNQATILQEGNSITTIVYRGQPDQYMLVNWQSLIAIVYQIQGNVEVQVYFFDQNNTKTTLFIQKSQSKKSDESAEKDREKQENILNNKNLITINLQNASLHLNQNFSSNSYEYFISIKPGNNLPSSLYTVVIINKQEHIINIKDGVPYEMKYSTEQNKVQRSELNSNMPSNQKTLNPIIKYRYICESEGVIMISTRYFQDIDIQVRCLDQLEATSPDFIQDLNNANSSKQSSKQVKKTKLQGKIIDIRDLLRIRQSYKMSNRLDLNINPKICTKYEITIAAKTSSVSYSVLISSTDIITLPLHKQVPGMLRYQSKLYQIYEISINQKTELRCTFKFCQGGDGRIMIAKSKRNIYTEIYQQQIEIYQQTTFSTLRYPAKPGLFYIKIQFKGRGGILQYTIHVENTNSLSISDMSSEQRAQKSQPDISPIRIYENFNEIDYKVLKVGYDYTQYQLQFYPIIYNGLIYDIQYYIVESTKLKLLKKTQNCNGQYFVELVNHHEEIKETKINIQQAKQALHQHQKTIKSTQAGKKQNENENWEKQVETLEQSEQKERKIKFSYQTKTPYTYVTVIPIIYNKQTHQFYHLYVPKYKEIQLKNGQLFAGITYFLSEIASRIEQFIDIHSSEKVILLVLIIVIGGCLCFMLLGGIWFGANYFFKTKTVYVLRQVRQDEDFNENEEQAYDNRIQDQSNNNMGSTVPMIRQQAPNHANQSFPQQSNGVNQLIMITQDRSQKQERKQITSLNKTEQHEAEQHEDRFEKIQKIRQYQYEGEVQI